MALRREVMKRVPGACPIETPAHESQSNGGIENCVKLFKGILRVHLSALEARIKCTIPTLPLSSFEIWESQIDSTNKGVEISGSNSQF